MYSFGIGGAGQLGLRKPSSASTPQVVLGPWISPSGVSLIPTASDVKNLVIQRIFAGKLIAAVAALEHYIFESFL